MIRLFAFAASHRRDSINRRLIEQAVEVARARGAEVDLADYADLGLPLYDDELFDPLHLPHGLLALAERLAPVHGVMIASPEYNWSYPGSLKNALDWISRLAAHPLQGKTALLLSASPSMKGGVLGLTHLRSPLEALDMHVFPQMFMLGRARETMQPDGTLTDDKQRQLLIRMITAYSDVTRRLAAP